MGLSARVRRIEEATLDQQMYAEAARLAAGVGCTPEALLREAEDLVARYGSLAASVAGLAAEWGVPEEQVRQEARRWG